MLEKLNCWMDIKAKCIALAKAINDQQHPSTTTTTSTYTLGLSSIKHNNEFITSKIQQSLYSSITKQNYIEWLSSKPTHPINASELNIHWNSLITARKEASIQMKIFITKSLKTVPKTSEKMSRYVLWKRSKIKFNFA